MGGNKLVSGKGEYQMSDCPSKRLKDKIRFPKTLEDMARK